MKTVLTPMIFLSFLLPCIGQVVSTNEEDRKRWNKRYDTKEYIYGTEPIEFLKDNINILTGGNALVLAMG